MPFPEVNRVIYKNNPLDKVICQFRFPTILKIESEIPALFQERIRHIFPKFTELSEIKFQISADIKNKGVNEDLNEYFQTGKTNNFEFLTEDEEYKLNLTRNFLTLSSNKYSRWENFREIFDVPIQALLDVYHPKHFTRIGLRYIDVICRSKLGENDTPWIELIRPEFLGLLSNIEIAENINSLENRYELNLLENNGIARIISKLVHEPGSDESCFMIDSDFFTHNKTEIDDFDRVLNHFNSMSGRLIQWIITKKLHECMGPTVI